MNREKIKILSKKKISYESLEKAKEILSKNYDISYGSYEPVELKKAIRDEKPIAIQGHLIIGYNPPDGKFIDDNNEVVTIERMIKAVIIDDEKTVGPMAEGVKFVIPGQNEWPDPIPEFHAIFDDLTVGEIFLPPHSAIFNFLKPTAETKEKKIVSLLNGVNINIYSRDNYVDNCIHEVGHLFYRDCVKPEERKAFKDLFKGLKPSAIYEWQWERKTDEEVFCTVYKWYIKSLLLNKSFYNILEHEEPRGLELLLKIFDRKAQDRLTEDIFNLKKNSVFEYLNPRTDKNTGITFVKQGVFDDIKDLILPESVLNDVDRYEDGVMFCKLDKATVPVKGNKIDYEYLAKARITNLVLTDFANKYKEYFKYEKFEV